MSEPHSPTLRVAALTTGRQAPSTRFRVRQHIDLLAQHGIAVSEHFPVIDKHMRIPFFLRYSHWEYTQIVDGLWRATKLAARLPGLLASHKSDMTWLQRELLPDHYSLERYLKQPVVFDFDDALWTLNPKAEVAIANIVRHASLVVAGNEYLAAWARQHNTRVRIVPTAINTDRFVPAKSELPRKGLTIGWTGTATNLPYLYAIEPALSRFLASHPNTELMVVCDKPPSFDSIPHSRVQFLRWSPEIEAASVSAMDIGLMPLPDTAWTRGKCSFKMLQYMSCAVPCVVSPVGLNADILRLGDVGQAAQCLDEWLDALYAYANQPEMRRQHGLTGRKIARDYFSQNVVASELADIFRSIAPHVATQS